MFRIDMLPAAQGDCLWIEYGDERRPRRVLIDGGPANKATYARLHDRVAQLPAGDRHFELIVVTHIDIDHIDGVVKLLEDPTLAVTYDDLWFNGYQHLVEEVENFGGRSGQRLTSQIALDRWNRRFRGKAVVVRGKPERVGLAGGMQLTVLSPTPAQLVALFPKWKAEAEAAGLDPARSAKPREPRPGVESFGPPDVERLSQVRYEADTTLPNGSSIALLAEFDGTSALLLADAYAEVVSASLDQLLGDNAPIEVAAVKVSHHGSAGNTPVELVNRIGSTRWLISSSGSYYRHPDAEAIARIVKHAPDGSEVIFNYASRFTEKWRSSALQRRYGYVSRYADKPLATTEVRLA